jgi:hypothetical protein
MIVGNSQRGDPPDHLAGKIEGLAARGQDTQRWTRRHQTVSQSGSGGREVFAVVQNEQGLLVAEIGGQRVDGGHTRALLQGEDLANLSGNRLAVGHRSQVGQPHSVGIVRPPIAPGP